MNNQVTIIGGGVIGLCAAYYLEEQGYEISLIEKGDITGGASFGNAGYVSPSHFTPLASPGIVAKGLRWMLSSSSPFYIKPRPNLDLIRWLFAFYRSANSQTMNRNIPPLNQILHLSRELMMDMKQELGNNFRMAEVGCFMLYKTASVEKHEWDLAKEAAALGIETRLYNAAEVQEMEPEVEVNVRGGVLYPIDCHLHPGDFMHSLKTYLEQKGIRFHLNAQVSGFEKTGDRVVALRVGKERIPVNELVLAGGSWIPGLSRELGIPLLLQAGKGYSITYHKVQRNLRRPAILVDARTAMTPMGEDLRMGGTMEISGINNGILIKRVEAIFKAAKDYYPDLPVSFPAMDKIWSGLRPLSPDGLPYIGRPENISNLTIAGGHAMLGISLAAATGKLVSEIVGHSKPSMDLTAFRIGRFS